MQHLVKTLMKNCTYTINWETIVAIYETSKLGNKIKDNGKDYFYL